LKLFNQKQPKNKDNEPSRAEPSRALCFQATGRVQTLWARWVSSRVGAGFLQTEPSSCQFNLFTPLF